MATSSYKGKAPQIAGLSAVDQAALNAAYESGMAGVASPKTQEQVDKEYTEATIAHPIFKGNTPEALTYAMATGDLSGLVKENDKPFTIEEQQAAVDEATKAEAASFEEEKAYDKEVAESKLRQKQLDYQNYLATSAVKFQTDKTNLDQTAANQGVLFSGGRAQKEKALQSAYDTEGAYKKASAGGDISGISRDYQYAYGSGAGNDLSSYYNLGGNTYNPNVATGGVGSSGLSSVYNASPTSYQGTNVRKKNVSAQQRAAGLLWNKGNKMVTGGISNQYKI
jgi:hypothetical protein